MLYSRMHLSGIASFTANSGDRTAGGISLYKSSVKITGNVQLSDNHAGIEGGGMGATQSY